MSKRDQLAPEYAAFTIEQRGIDIIPPAERKAVTTDELHMSVDYNCWEGWELCGRVKATILRGSVLLQEGAWVGDKVGGRYLRRTLDSRFLRADAV